jgi:hypothetical protein
MGLLVKHTKEHKSGRIEFRRAFPPELRDFIVDGGNAGRREHKVPLGTRGTPGLLSRWEAALADFDNIVATRLRLTVLLPMPTRTSG